VHGAAELNVEGAWLALDSFRAAVLAVRPDAGPPEEDEDEDSE
jgi:hypothetical protein